MGQQPLFLYVNVTLFFHVGFHDPHTALTSLRKPRPPGEKKKRIIEIQKLEITENEHKIPQIEKGTAIKQGRRNKGFLNEREHRRIEKGSPVAEQSKIQAHTLKQSSNHVVVEIDRKETKIGVHQENNTSKVRQPEALHIFLNCMNSLSGNPHSLIDRCLCYCI